MWFNNPTFKPNHLLTFLCFYLTIFFWNFYIRILLGIFMFCFLRFSFFSLCTLSLHIFLYKSDWFAINNKSFAWFLFAFILACLLWVCVFIFFCFSKFLVLGGGICSFRRYLCELWPCFIYFRISVQYGEEMLNPSQKNFPSGINGFIFGSSQHLLWQ